MSRTIETLKKVPSKDDILHENIISTYFYQKSHKKKHKHLLINIKPAFVALLGLAILLATGTGSKLFRDSYIDYLKKKTSTASVITIFGDGSLNREIIKVSGFHGSAKEKSTFTNGAIVFSNPKKYSWSDFSVDFKFPIDLSKRKLSLKLHGKIGGERLLIVLKDTNNRSARLGEIYAPSGWEAKNITFADIKKDINLSSITHLRIECGYVGEAKMDSPVDVTIYIKEFKILKEA